MTLTLASEFARSGIPTHFVVASGEGPLRDVIPPEVTLVDLQRSKTRSALIGLASYLSRFRPRALITSKTHVNVIAIIANLVSRSRTHLIVCEHSRFQFEESRGVRSAVVLSLAKRFYPLASHIVAVAPSVAQACSIRLNLQLERIQVIPNPVFDDELHRRLEEPVHPPGLGENGFLYLGVGRLVPEKDFNTLIRSFQKVAQTIRSRLIILGEGPERPELEELIDDLGLAQSVALPGQVDNPLVYMREADAFVLSSRSEGFPMVLVEAMYAGNLIIATTCSDSISTILEGGRYGTLVPVGAVEALADAMVAVAQGPPPDVTAARARVQERYGVEKIASLYKALITD